MCDLPMMSGETASHLNPSLAVRLPLSRSGSREHDDFNASCDDDIPSTIGGSCSRTHSATELSVTGRVIESGFLEPGRGSRRGREEGFLRPKVSSAGDDGSIGTEERSSPGSQQSRVTAAEVHIPRGEEEESARVGREPGTDRDEKPDQQANCSSERAEHRETIRLQTVESVPQSQTDGSSPEVATSLDISGRNSAELPDKTPPTSHDSTAGASSPETLGHTQQTLQKSDEATVRGEETTSGSGENGISHGSASNRVNILGSRKTGPAASDRPEIGDQNYAATSSVE